MKKLLLLITVFTIVITANAQISGGLKAGLNLTTFSGDIKNATDEVKQKPGFHLGGYVNIGFNENLSIQPELLLSTAGAKLEEKESGFSNESTFKLSYLSMPLSLQYSFGNFNVHTGPQLSFLLSAKEEYTTTITNGGSTATQSGENDVKKRLKDVDFGLNFGAGINFGKLGISARYSLGVANVADPEDLEDEDYKLTNNVIQVAVMYKLFGK